MVGNKLSVLFNGICFYKSLPHCCKKFNVRKHLVYSCLESIILFYIYMYANKIFFMTYKESIKILGKNIFANFLSCY